MAHQHSAQPLTFLPLSRPNNESAPISQLTQDTLVETAKTNIYLRSPTKGNMMLVKFKTWEFFDIDMPNMDWIPSVSAITNQQEL